jgi:hypothetical protein
MTSASNDRTCARGGLRARGPVETSSQNYQVWLNHERVLSHRFLCTFAARQLASRFGGDQGIAVGALGTAGRLRRVEEGMTTGKRISALRQAATMRGPCLLSGRRGSSRGGGAEARRPLAVRAARHGAASEEQHPCSVKSLRSAHVHAAGDLHSSDMAWALHGAARGLSCERIEPES